MAEYQQWPSQIGFDRFEIRVKMRKFVTNLSTGKPLVDGAMLAIALDFSRVDAPTHRFPDSRRGETDSHVGLRYEHRSLPGYHLFTIYTSFAFFVACYLLGSLFCFVVNLIRSVQAICADQ